MPDENYCTNCRHRGAPEFNYGREVCNHPSGNEYLTTLKDGAAVYTVPDAAAARVEGGICGPNGRLWEPK